MRVEAYRPIKAEDEYGGVAYNNVVHDLADLVGDLGFNDMKQELKDAELMIDHLPKEEGAPDWESYIFNEIVESGMGTCMDVRWL